jgi:arabinan endo-1,5-alpha-L-arabinosidase
VVQCDGKYYTFGTGQGGLISDDGWTWHAGAVRPGGGAAPDIIKIGDRYLVAYGATGGGLGGRHNGKILTMWNQTLDPHSPDFKYSEAIVVASSDGDEDCDAIDPGLCMAPDGRLWLTYGTYFGFIRVVELDPKTGKRVEGNQPVNIAIDCEATDMIYRDGWFYLFGTHGTCCSGSASTYNIRVGRSKSPTGPFIDNMNIEMLKGGGKLLIAANNRLIGPGHFGLIDLGDGVQKFSCHYEADLDRGGRSVLDIRTLLWKDGWPVAGEAFTGGTFEIESERSGYALELAVEGARIGGRGGARGGFGRGGVGPVIPIQLPDPIEVTKTWPAGDIDLRIGDYMLGTHQKWTIAPVAGAGGYLGSPYFKITIAGTDRALAATADAEVVTVPTFSGKAEELWRIDQLTDGTYRIMPKAVAGSKESLALTAVGSSTPSLAKFDPMSPKARWNLKSH